MIRILTSLVAVFTIGSVQAQQTARETPKLVVGITIDQLRGDYLELFQQTFTERGFKRLLSEGLVYQNIRYDFPNIDDASAIATIYTGTVPFYHGITGNKKYLAIKQKEVPTFDDPSFLGNYTQDNVSPLAIKTSTITDELKVASRGSSDVYSFAPNLGQALITAGVYGNTAYWVDDYTGKWASSTFYKNFYWAVDQENRSGTDFSANARGMRWSPLLDIKAYKAFPFLQGVAPFAHYIGVDKDAYIQAKQTPSVNENVRNTALKLLTKAELGKRISPDFLSVTFYAGNFNNTADYSIEIQDAYARLDREIEKLLDEIEKTVGLKNTLIFLASTGYYNSNEAEYKPEQTIPEKKFYINRCEALLNMYLMAIYGKDGKWVDKFHNGQIYLNRELIKQKEISLQEIQSKAAEFVFEFTGVQEVYTSFQLQHGQWNPVMEYYRNAYTRETSGDLFVELQPGFKMVNDQDTSFKEKQVRNNAVVCPVIFFGNGIKPQKVKRTIKATEIAPTVSYIMRIRSPNAAKEEALSELL
ncbi:alkaline phosphatase family protein [Dysgonomonas sp. 511]|uniref:alkaline phosphatase family protein n=1 Tax=Dysgonomonas sp. 511 TaxID=2302930 RepID=UPI0013D55861|nr:alkaline phosphatase family protein [Dysgonomonas sp. 511]NDV79374.1 alkaline phosphatase family protein [Dysgonomonas sp. 511]